MKTLLRVTLCLLVAACFASLAQARNLNLYQGSMNGQVGFGVPIPFAGIHTTPGGPSQSPNIRGVGIPGPTGVYAYPSVNAGRALVTPAGGFTLQAGDFFVSTSYVNPNPTTPTFQYSASIAMLSNQAGSFGNFFFTGAFGTSNTATIIGVGAVGTSPLGTAIFRPGAGFGFGGVMRLAGTFVNILSIQTPGLAISTVTAPLTPTWLGGPSVPNTDYSLIRFSNTMFGPTYLPLKFSGFPWITGKVSLIQSQGAITSLLTEIGTNNMKVTLHIDELGKLTVATGNIKMVTGWMTHWLFVDENVGEYVLNLNFLPEPNSAMLLGAGGLFIAALYRVRRRSA